MEHEIHRHDSAGRGWRLEAEAEANIEGAIRECLAVRAQQGLPLTVSTREVEVAV